MPLSIVWKEVTNIKEFDFNNKANKKLVSKFNTLLQHQGEKTFKKGFQNVCSSILESYDVIKVHSNDKGMSLDSSVKNCYIFKLESIEDVIKTLECQGYKWGGTLLRPGNDIVVVKTSEFDKNFGKCYKII